MIETHQNVMEVTLKGLQWPSLGQFEQENNNLKKIVIDYNQLNKINIY